MKKFHLHLIFASVLPVVLSSGCAGKSETPPPPVKLLPFNAENEQKSLAVSTEFAGAFAAALQNGDFKLWQDKMPQHIAGKVTPEIFSRMCREVEEMLGKLENSSYFGTLQNGNLRDNFWKLRFVKDGKVREVLYMVRVYCTENGDPEISGFGIKRF